MSPYLQMRQSPSKRCGVSQDRGNYSPVRQCNGLPCCLMSIGPARSSRCLIGKGPAEGGVEAVVDRWSGSWGVLGLGERFELAGERQDLAGQGGRFDAFELGVHGDLRPGADGGVGERTLVRCRRGVVFLGDFGAGADLGDQLLLGQEVVGEDGVEVPDGVQQVPFGFGVVAVVADQLANPGPVLLLDVGAVVGVPWPGPGEGDLAADAPGEQVVVNELAAVSESIPMMGNGNWRSTV